MPLQMALPTLPSYWSSRRPQDQNVARQREQKAQLRQQWEQNSRYFRTSDFRSSKQAQWSSETSYQRRQVSVCPACWFLPLAAQGMWPQDLGTVAYDSMSNPCGDAILAGKWGVWEKIAREIACILKNKMYVEQSFSL